MALKQFQNVDVSDENCSTSLHKAASNGQTEIVKILFENGVDLNCRGKNGETAIHWAALYGKTETAQWLITNRQCLANIFADAPAQWCVKGTGAPQPLKTAFFVEFSH